MESNVRKNMEAAKPVSTPYFKILQKKYINLHNIIWYVITVIVKIIAEKESKKKLLKAFLGHLFGQKIRLLNDFNKSLRN
jgi:hypothetical protein